MTRPLEGRIALVTGASRGIGAAVAERFAAEGADLVAVARTVGGLEELDDRIRERGGRATLVPLDLADGAGIDRLGGAIAERHGRLDILVGNAAELGRLGPIAQFSPQEWQPVIDINLTANWRLIRAFDPLLRAAEAGRAIFVTSGAARASKAYWGAYAVSKAALEALVKTYAAEIARTGVRANLLDPGIVRTRMRARAFPGEEPLSLPEPSAVTDRFVELASPAWRANGQVVAA